MWHVHSFRHCGYGTDIQTDGRTDGLKCKIISRRTCGRTTISRAKMDVHVIQQLQSTDSFEVCMNTTICSRSPDTTKPFPLVGPCFGIPPSPPPPFVRTSVSDCPY